MKRITIHDRDREIAQAIELIRQLPEGERLTYLSRLRTLADMQAHEGECSPAAPATSE